MTKILIVDDDDTNRLLVINTLMEANPDWRLFSAINGQVALDLCHQIFFDLIILDWEMPVLNGIDFLIAIKQKEQWKDIPVILYTGIMKDASFLKKALELGANEFLRKPVEDVELIARVQSVLRLKKAEEEKLEAKNRELATLTLQISETNNFLNSLVHDLELLRQEHRHIQGLAKLKRSISTQLKEDRYWEDIKLRITSIYSSFFENLEAHYPDLTSNQTMLAGFLKIGLTNKEIASILCITAKGLEKSRSRLRKKLNLAPTDNMEKFLMKF